MCQKFRKYKAIWLEIKQVAYAFGLDDQKMGRTVSLLRLAFAARRQGKVRRGSECHNPSCWSIVVVATSLNS